MSSKHVLQFFSLFLLSSTATGQLDAYTCDRQSKSNVGDLLDKVISVEYCLDADPVPSSIFESSPYNALTLVVENDFNPVIFHLEGGMYIGADGFYINSVFVYPRDECKQSAKQSKRDKGSNKKHARQLKGETKPAPSCTKYPNGAILVDAPASFGTGYGARLNKFLATRGATLQVMILTHEHWDHMGGVHNVIAANPNLNFFVAGEEVVDTLRKYETLTFENERVNQIYRSNPLYQRSLTFDLQIQENTEITFTRGNQTLRIMSGFGHTPGNLVIWNEATAALINIDALVYPKYA
jgi:glyoxylase-like metal-dependent hydrolase (beta-lactamase superfamily II)